MNILIVYATNSGSTVLAAEHMNSVLNTKHNSAVVSADSIDVQDFGSHDHVFLLSNTWFYKDKEGQPHLWYLEKEDEFKNAHHPDTSFSIIGFGDSSYAEFAGAADVLKEYVDHMSGNLVGELLRIDAYLANESHNNRILSEWLSDLVK